jgi:hypothetical protein
MMVAHEAMQSIGGTLVGVVLLFEPTFASILAQISRSTPLTRLPLFALGTNLGSSVFA